MSMIDNVAMAIAQQDLDDGDGTYDWYALTDEISDVYRAVAKVAIEAMREPQVEMIAAFWRQKNCGTQEIGKAGDATSDYDAYRAMIDAALREEP